MNPQHWWQAVAPLPQAIYMVKARQHQNQLTKPAGALGRLEEIAIRLAALQGTETPKADHVAIAVFAGDHGVVEEGVSAFPQVVTVEMMKNFVAGGAAINVMARHIGAALRVINVGSLAAPGSLPGVVDRIAGRGTANFCKAPAMSWDGFCNAMAAGHAEATLAAEKGAQIVIGGEMGIGNTTAATALLAHRLDLAPATLAGPGTGLNAEGVAHKVRIVEQALQLHGNHFGSAEKLMQHLGGYEIAALAGFYIAGAQAGLAVVVDGFICTAAALMALAMNTSISPYLFFSHASAEPGFKALNAFLPSAPLLDMQFRLGEGSGAACCIPLFRMACAIHNEMATFAQAQVSEKTE